MQSDLSHPSTECGPCIIMGRGRNIGNTICCTTMILTTVIRNASKFEDPFLKVSWVPCPAAVCLLLPGGFLGPWPAAVGLLFLFAVRFLRLQFACSLAGSESKSWCSFLALLFEVHGSFPWLFTRFFQYQTRGDLLKSNCCQE